MIGRLRTADCCVFIVVRRSFRNLAAISLLSTNERGKHFFLHAERHHAPQIPRRIFNNLPRLFIIHVSTNFRLFYFIFFSILFFSFYTISLAVHLVNGACVVRSQRKYIFNPDSPAPKPPPPHTHDHIHSRQDGCFGFVDITPSNILSVVVHWFGLTVWYRIRRSIITWIEKTKLTIVCVCRCVLVCVKSKL